MTSLLIEINKNVNCPGGRPTYALLECITLRLDCLDHRQTKHNKETSMALLSNQSDDCHPVACSYPLPFHLLLLRNLRFIVTRMFAIVVSPHVVMYANVCLCVRVWCVHMATCMRVCDPRKCLSINEMDPRVTKPYNLLALYS